MRTRAYFRYSTQVWLTSLFVSPALIFLLMQMREGGDFFRNFSEGYIFLILVVLFGAIFSLPAWLLLSAGVAASDRPAWPEAGRRLLLQLWAGILTFGTFTLFFQGANFLGDGEKLLFPVCYFLTNSFGIWMYRLAPVETREEEFVPELTGKGH